MLRQLRRLSRTFEVGGVRMSAPAIYAEKGEEGWHLERARESGYEGVACVDDAARLAVLLLRAHERHGLPWALEWATLNLRFVLHLQQPDGAFANFILDWSGAPNLSGPTSRPGGAAWQGRALWALAVAYRVTGDPAYRDRYRAALAALPTEIEFADILATVALALLEMHAASPEPGRLELLDENCRRIAALSRDGVLLNHEEERCPHLWGFIQPAVLCRAARVLGRPEWLELARATADRCLSPVVRGGFDFPRTLPYEVSSTAWNLEELHAATGEAGYAELASLARGWFRGRNPAGRPVYDPALGMVFDGVDGDRVSLNSGAESNIEGAFALFDELPWRGYRFP